MMETCYFYAIVMSIGCGDGRICIEATKRFGCRSVGCEIEEQLIEKFQSNILKDLPEHLQNKDIIRVVSGEFITPSYNSTI